MVYNLYRELQMVLNTTKFFYMMEFLIPMSFKHTKINSQIGRSRYASMKSFTSLSNILTVIGSSFSWNEKLTFLYRSIQTLSKKR